jgi:hypothetical protein
MRVNESYKHRAAKNIMYQWLSDSEKSSLKDHLMHRNRFCGFYWRKNYGIHLELPVYCSSSIYYFEEDTPIDDTILFRPDITIFHKGTAKYFIEIVVTNPVSSKKLDKMISYNRNTSVVEINADDILMNTGVPESLKVNIRYLSHPATYRWTDLDYWEIKRIEGKRKIGKLNDHQYLEI